MSRRGEENPLHVLVGGRKSGKTTRLLELLRGTPSGLLVVSNNANARHLADLGYGSQLVTPGQIRNGELQGRHTRLLIDDAEFMLRSMIGPYHEITALSFTGEGEILRREPRPDGGTEG